MRYSLRLGIGALAVCLLCTTASALTVPVKMEVIPPSTTFEVGDTVDLLVTVDTTDVPAGLDTAGLRLMGADPAFKVIDIVPGLDFPFSVVEIDPPYSGFSYPGAMLAVDLLALTGAMGTDLELATFSLEAIAPGVADLTLDFWAEPSPPAGSGTFDSFVAFWDGLNGLPEPSVLDPYVVFSREPLTLEVKAPFIIPEPCSMGILLLGGVVVGLTKRRRSC